MLKTVLNLVLGASLLSVVACKKEDSFVKDLHLKTKNVDESVYVEVSSILDLKNIQLPSLQFPIKNFNNGDVYGSLYFAPTLDGRSEIAVDINLTTITKLPAVDPSLPNGLKLPVGGADRLNVVQVDIPQVNGRVYVALDTLKKFAMVGFAVSIPQADGIGTAIGEGQLFPNFKIGKVNLFAGVYTSTSPSSTGIAVFTDISSVLPEQLAELALYSDFVTAEEFAAALNSKTFSKRENYFEKLKADIDPAYALKLKKALADFMNSQEKVQVKF
jgi:hypothetical protein